jgi:hypothetical protein
MFHALLTGINTYRYAPILPHCLDDVIDFGNLVEGVVPKQHIATMKHLVNTSATKNVILTEFRALVEKCKPGDDVLFYFSGHGMQKTSYGHDETDNLDECLVPVDYDTTSGSVIFDDELEAIGNKVPEGARLTFILDACHSEIEDNYKNPSRKFLHIDDCKFLVVSACINDGKASNGTNGRNSALSAALIDECKQNPGTTWVQIIDGINRRLAEDCYSQVAQIHGPAELLNSYPFGGM